MSLSARTIGYFMFSLFLYLVFIEAITEKPSSYRHVEENGINILEAMAFSSINSPEASFQIAGNVIMLFLKRDSGPLTAQLFVLCHWLSCSPLN